jgi:hypothetical protein
VTEEDWIDRQRQELLNTMTDGEREKYLEAESKLLNALKEPIEKSRGYPVGWVCPLCGCVYSPFVATCPNHIVPSVMTNTTNWQAKP